MSHPSNTEQHLKRGVFLFGILSDPKREREDSENSNAASCRPSTIAGEGGHEKKLH